MKHYRKFFLASFALLFFIILKVINSTEVQAATIKLNSTSATMTVNSTKTLTVLNTKSKVMEFKQ